jgi:uncharacterized phage protein (TIGR01671 family)
MRDIKIRAYNKSDKSIKGEFSVNNIIADGYAGASWISADNGFCLREDESLSDFILVESTGPTDKNRKEIYEGDIIKEIYHPLGSNPKAYEWSKIGVVEYQYNAFGITWKLENGKVINEELCSSHHKNYSEVYKHPTAGLDWFDKSITFSRIEVIGNIYQNPELINKQ